MSIIIIIINKWKKGTMTTWMKLKLTAEPKSKIMFLMKKKTKDRNRKYGKRGHLYLKIQMIDGRDRRKERVARLNKSKMTEDMKDGLYGQKQKKNGTFLRKIRRNPNTVESSSII